MVKPHTLSYSLGSGAPFETRRKSYTLAAAGAPMGRSHTVDLDNYSPPAEPLWSSSSSQALLQPPPSTPVSGDGSITKEAALACKKWWQPSDDALGEGDYGEAGPGSSCDGTAEASPVSFCRADQMIDRLARMQESLSES